MYGARGNGRHRQHRRRRRGGCVTVIRFSLGVVLALLIAGAELTISGFTSVYGEWVSIVTALAICCFAFTTAIGWGLYGSRCVEFVFGHRAVRPFLVVYSLVAVLGATLDIGLVWDVADTFNGLMVVPNLLALFLLSGTLVRILRGE